MSGKVHQRKKVVDPLDDLWQEIDSTDWKKQYRGVFAQMARDRKTDRIRIRQSIIRDRNIELAIDAIRRKRTIQKKVLAAIAS